MRKILLAIILLAGAANAALVINFEEPSGEYAFGTIPVLANFTNGSETITDASLKAELKKGNVVLDTEEMVRTGDLYSCSFNIEEGGDYTVRAFTTYLEESYESTRDFSVNSTRISIEIVSPENKTYMFSPEFKVNVLGAGKFVHGAEVSALVYRGGEEKEERLLPEGNGFYRASTDLIPGFYRIEVKASKDGQEVEEEVEFIVSGEVNGTFIPGEKIMTIERAPPLSSKYQVGSKTSINVLLIDKLTGEKMRVSDADVEAEVVTPSKTREIKLAYEDDMLNPKYTGELLLDEKGWYEISISAFLDGYSNATLEFTPINVGSEVIELPADMGCAEGICIKVHYPVMGETYPMNDTVPVRLQLLEDTDSKPPIDDAQVWAKNDQDEENLSYDKNGYYEGEIGPLQEGEQEVMFLAEWEDVAISNTTSFFVSPDRLKIALVNPKEGSNVTEEFVMLEVRVTDQEGEVIPGVNARAVITSPTKALSNPKLSRNAETGNYEEEYTFSEEGTHKVKVVVSKPGFVSATREFSFRHEKEEETMQFDSTAILVVVLLVGIVLVLLAVWKGLL